MVFRAPPDGYTVGLVSDSHAINHLLSQTPRGRDILGTRVPYDAQTDFMPVAGAALVPLALVVNPQVPASNVKELVALSTSRKDRPVTFATMGPGSPWAMHMFQLASATGASLTDVAYKGLAPAATDLVGGSFESMVMPLHFAQQYVRTGKLRALATLGEKRHPLLPDVPTLAESGFPGLTLSNWLFYVVPKGTPQPVVDRLSRAINNAQRNPGMQQKFGLTGDTFPASPEELTARLRKDLDMYGAVIRTTIPKEAP